MNFTGTLTETLTTSSVILYPTSAEQSSGQGDNWPNLENLTTEGGVATCSLNLYGSSEVLTLSGFEGALPAEATITGYTIRFPRRQTNGTSARDLRVRLGHGTMYGENLARSESWPTAQMEEAAYTVANDLNLTPAQAASPDFKLEILVSDEEQISTVEVGRPSVEVHYTVAGWKLTAESV